VFDILPDHRLSSRKIPDRKIPDPRRFPALAGSDPSLFGNPSNHKTNTGTGIRQTPACVSVGKFTMINIPNQKKMPSAAGNAEVIHGREVFGTRIRTW